MRLHFNDDDVVNDLNPPKPGNLKPQQADPHIINPNKKIVGWFPPLIGNTDSPDGGYRRPSIKQIDHMRDGAVKRIQQQKDRSTLTWVALFGVAALALR